MTDTYNAIWVGYAFSQDFEADPGAIVDGAVLWLDLRSAGARKSVLLQHLELERLSPTLFRLTLSAEQTAGLAAGEVMGDLICRIGGVDYPLALRLAIPVVQPLSEPA